MTITVARAAATLGIFRIFFSLHISLLILTAAGAIFLATGLFLELFANANRLAAILANASSFMGGMWLIFGFIWSGVVFRQLVSNRRFSLLPAFRSLAVVALLLVAVIASLVGLGLMLLAPAELSRSIAINGALLLFATASGFLLLQQILCTTRIGFVFQVVMFIALFNAPWRAPELVSVLLEPAPFMVLAALLGWVWLWLAVRNRSNLAGPNQFQRVDNWGNQPANQWGGTWSLNLGGRANPFGSLLRGNRDSLANRVGMLGILQLGIPLIWILISSYTIPRRGSNPFVGPEVFLLVSYFGIVMILPTFVTEWPARLKLLWLRSGGERRDLWQLLERSLWNDIGIIALVAAVLAPLCLRYTSVQPALVIVYASGTIAAVAAACYIGFWFRARSNSLTIIYFAMNLAWMLLLVGVVTTYGALGAYALFWFVVFYSAVALVFRTLARNRLLTIDWCAVRPNRRQRTTRVTAEAAS